MLGQEHGAVITNLDITPPHERADEGIALVIRSSGLLVDVFVGSRARELSEAQESAEKVALGGGFTHGIPLIRQ